MPSLLAREKRLGYILVLPAIIYLVLLVGYPFVISLYISFTDKIVTQPGSFVGLGNFLYLLKGYIFRQTIRNTLIYTAACVTLKLAAGMLMALLLNQQFRGRNLLRGFFLLPWVVPMAIGALGWLWMYDSSYGAINSLIRVAGLRGIPWLSVPFYAMLSVIIANVWRGTPFFGMLILAGLYGIPNELYEAAEVDGAGIWSKFLFITLPQLRYVIMVATLFSTIWTLADFETVFIITRGGPFNTTHLLATLTYQVGMEAGQLGRAAAVSIFLFPFLFVAIYLQLKYVRKE